MKSRPAAKAKTSTSKKTVAAKPPVKAPRTKAASGRDKNPAAQTTSLNIPHGVLLGAHTSTSGGVSQAIGRAQACGFTAAQIFVKNNKQWFAPPLSDAEITQFRAARQ